MDNKRLLKLSKSIATMKGSEKYFEFASNYLMNDTQHGVRTTQKFFNMLLNSQTRANYSTVKSAFGVSGKNSADIKTWIGYIINRPDLKSLSIKELNYVMANASRYAKVNSTK